MNRWMVCGLVGIVCVSLIACDREQPQWDTSIYPPTEETTQPPTVESEITDGTVVPAESTENATSAPEVEPQEPTGYVSLPTTLYVEVGSECRIYDRNVISQADARLYPEEHAALTVLREDTYVSICPTEQGRHTVRWEARDSEGKTLDCGTVTVVAVEADASSITALVIGDSTVNAGVMTQTLLGLYAEKGGALTLLGTRGTAPNLHEGRGGWKARNYCESRRDETYGENPFYSERGFDFAGYMTAQGYGGVDAVVIQLGINDVFPFTQASYNSAAALASMEQIITSIHAYDSEIRIIVNLPPTPNSNGVGFQETYGEKQQYEVYRYNIIRYAAELRARFEERPNVTVAATNCVLDTDVHIRDGVHPTTEGYEILARQLFEVMLAVASA